MGATAIALLYLAHFLFCSHSALPDFIYYFTNSDMHANLQWAINIKKEGWLNPHPYHPYNDWMQEIAPYETWVKWWGGEAVFQQSPLYAYLFAFYLHFSQNPLFIHLAQCLAGALLCGMLALLAWVVFEDRRAAAWTLVLAGLYAPFYGYAWPLLRDLLGWILTVAVLITLTLWCRASHHGRPGWGLSAAVGALFGLGLLAREVYYLVIPLSLGMLAWKSRRTGQWKSFAIVAAALALVLLPLIYRNAVCGAPWLSTSNRFAENFIEGNAASARPAALHIPVEMRDILEQNSGRPLGVVSATLATHPDGLRGWIILQLRKLASLLDPYEPPDNLSLYYLGEISPLVRFGLPHWLILVPGIGGFLLGLRRRDIRQGWLWLFLLCTLAALLSTTVLSRYRQSLALFWIPWAGYLFAACQDWKARHRHFALALTGLALLIGWWLCWSPFSVRPRQTYARSVEYRLAAVIYEKRGEPQKASDSMNLFKKRQIEH